MLARQKPMIHKIQGNLAANLYKIVALKTTTNIVCTKLRWLTTVNLIAKANPLTALE